MEKWSKDSLILQRRKGTSDSPYIDINESLKIDGTNRVSLRELPSKYHGVTVTGDGKNWFEVEKAIETNTEFVVDYESGMVTFHQSHSGKQLNFSYKGTGQSFTPANRIYTKRDGQTIVETLEEVTERAEYQADLVDTILQTGNVSSVNGKTGMVDGIAEQEDLEEVDERLSSHLKDIVQVNLKDYAHLVVEGDWKPAFDKALSEGDKIYVPKGLYPTSAVTVPSYKEIYGDGRETVMQPLGTSLFIINGSLGDEIPLTVDIEMSTDTISLSNTASLHKKDYILLKSQRSALDENDAGEEFCLGVATPNSPPPYFGEFLEIEEVYSNRVKVSKNTMFYDYFIDKSRETSPFARDKSTVQKVNFVEGVILKDFNISHTVSDTISFEYGLDCRVENVSIFDKTYTDGTAGFIKFMNSLNCSGVECSHIFQTVNYPEYYYSTNIYKITSSINCGFSRCYTKQGGQPFDITYSRSSIPSINCYVHDCSIDNANRTGITTHGGTFQCLITNNRIYGSGQGINNRCRSSTISNNMISTENTRTQTSYGIALYERWAVDCIVAGNTINGFTYGIVIADGSELNQTFGYIGSIISNNTIKNFTRGIYILRSANNRRKDFRAIYITNNTLQTRKTGGETIYGVYFSPYMVGTFVHNNVVTVYKGSGDCTGIYYANNIHQADIKGNTIRNFGTGIRIGTMTDSEYTEDGRGHQKVGDNYFINVATETNFAANVINVNTPSMALPLTQYGTSTVMPNNSIFTLTNGNLYYKFPDGTTKILASP